jgi:hypothetical protein
MEVKVPYLISANPSAPTWNSHEAAEVKLADTKAMLITGYKVSSENFGS